MNTSVSNSEQQERLLKQNHSAIITLTPPPKSMDAEWTHVSHISPAAWTLYPRSWFVWIRARTRATSEHSPRAPCPVLLLPQRTRRPSCGTRTSWLWLTVPCVWLSWLLLPGVGCWGHGQASATQLHTLRHEDVTGLAHCFPTRTLPPTQDLPTAIPQGIRNEWPFSPSAPSRWNCFKKNFFHQLWFVWIYW